MQDNILIQWSKTQNQIENCSPPAQFSIKRETGIKSVILPYITNAYKHKMINNLGYTKKLRITFI